MTETTCAVGTPLCPTMLWPSHTENALCNGLVRVNLRFRSPMSWYETLPHPSRQGRPKTGPSPVDRARTGSMHHVITDGAGVPLGTGPTRPTRQRSVNDLRRLQL